MDPQGLHMECVVPLNGFAPVGILFSKTSLMCNYRLGEESEHASPPPPVIFCLHFEKDFSFLGTLIPEQIHR